MTETEQMAGDLRERVSQVVVALAGPQGLKPTAVLRRDSTVNLSGQAPSSQLEGAGDLLLEGAPARPPHGMVPQSV